MADAYTWLAPLVRCLPPEAAHHLGLWALHWRLLPSAPAAHHPALKVNVLGLSFPSPIGLSAGFDKNAAVVDGLLRQGFGFVEAGTVTPLPQPGNPKPRIFRLVEDEAVINRLGFNNEGLDVFVRNIKGARHAGIIGANIGKNKDTIDATADYVRGLRAVYAHADYVTVNISSPNTPGLRSLQQGDALASLLSALADVRGECAIEHKKRVPLLLKIAPDLGQHEREDIARQVIAHGIDALIISNTTIARPASLKSLHHAQQGGLSGRPLFAPSNEILKDFYRLTGGKIPLIGVGGIASAPDAYDKIRAGATLVQLYTALVYQGFSLVRRMESGLAALLARDGFASVADAVGADAKR